MKKAGIIIGAFIVTIATLSSCKECKTCEVTTIREVSTMQGNVWDTTVVSEEICGMLLENVDGKTFADSAADGTNTIKEYNCGG